MKKLLLALALLLGLAAPAMAANCGSYPYTLTNGQVADANQVMANFNSILGCANNLVPAGPNSTITSLTGLTTPLAVSEGGTGANNAPGALSNLGAVPLAGGIMTGQLILPASTTSAASFNIPIGVTPTAPNPGDFWTTATGLFAYVNGTPTKFVGFPGLVPISGIVTQNFTLNMSNAVVFVTTPSANSTELDIPINTGVNFDLGVQINVINNCTSSRTTVFSVASGVSLYWIPSGTLITTPGLFRTLAVCGSATLTKVGTNVWTIQGFGLT